MEAAKKMHDKGFVHGGLRNSNVLCRKTDSELKFLFIDWDWAGKARDTIKYPATTNTDIHRHRDAKPSSPILQAHDEYMLGIMFS
jgi:tRNA A-37 threonylcarbamoyl transferase component Bud32